MLAGSARVTAIDQDGRNFIDDVKTGDLWNFRAGLPHSIQALADGCEFLLVFDDGAFSENETFLLTDWFLHTPLQVLAKNLGVPESALANIPKDPDHERYIFSGQVPPALANDVVRGPAGPAMSMTWRLLEQEPVEVPGGRVRIVDSSNFAGKARTFDYQAGDVGYVPFAMGHYILNTGDEPLRFLEMFRSSR
jgi:oxalate decarboxylase